MNVKYVITAVISGGIGFAAGWFIKQKLDDKLIATIAEELTADANIPDLSAEDLVDQELADSAIQAVSKYKGVTINPPKKVILHEEDMHPMDSNEDINTGEDKPYLITVEQYEDEDDNWDKAEYVFYTHRDDNNPYGFLVDEVAQTKVMDPHYDIGQVALDILRNTEKTKNGDVVYVRNPYLHCDIMITASDDIPDYEIYDMPSMDYDGGVKG